MRGAGEAVTGTLCQTCWKTGLSPPPILPTTDWPGLFTASDSPHPTPHLLHTVFSADCSQFLPYLIELFAPLWRNFFLFSESSLLHVDETPRNHCHCHCICLNTSLFLDSSFLLTAFSLSSYVNLEASLGALV